MNLLRVTAHFSRWLEQHGIGLDGLSSERIEEYFEHRKKSGYTHFHSKRSLEPALSYLERASLVELTEVPERAEHHPLKNLLESYDDYLVKERTLRRTTADFYVRIAREFLSRYVEGDLRKVSLLTTAELSAFIIQEAQGCSTSHAQYKASALRSIFRYLYVHEHIGIDLSVSVPAVAGWKQSSLPKALSAKEVRKLLKSCDRRTHCGRRNYAVLLLMVRLGLRAGEVAAVELDDISWKRGEILIRGKGNQRDRLPLPKDVGEALASYVQRSRPAIATRKVFARSRAPYRALGVGGIQSIVVTAGRRADVSPVSAHRLRHTAATEMLRQQVPLPDIAQVLRHRHLDSTAIYAKVDRQALRTLARPWLGGGVA